MKSISMSFRRSSTHRPLVEPFLASIIDEVLQPLTLASASSTPVSTTILWPVDAQLNPVASTGNEDRIGSHAIM
jgi:hypothetical protein